MSTKATSYHKISATKLAREGVPLTKALTIFTHALKEVHDVGEMLVAHHLEFDLGILHHELLRAEMHTSM